jgi:hypothetical protein
MKELNRVIIKEEILSENPQAGEGYFRKKTAHKCPFF